MPFEAAWHKSEREQRQQSLFPELRLADFSSTFEVDRLRRDEGREPTSLGMATESAWINDISEEAAPRGAYESPSFLNDPEATNPFLKMQAQESEARFAQNAAQTSLNPLDALGTMLGGISHNLDRPRGGFFAALEEGGAPFSLPTLRAGYEGLKRPEDFGGGDIQWRKGMGDTDLIGSLSARDIIGGVADIALDPLNVFGGGAAKAAGRAVGESAATRAIGRGARELATSERAAIELGETGETAVSKLTSMIRSAKPLQEQNKELLHQFRQRQAGAFAGTFRAGTGEEGFTRGLSALRGQAERMTFEPLRPQLAQEDIDGFINTIGTSRLRPFEQVGAGTALRNILDGQVPTPSDLVELEKVFPGTVKSLRDAKIINGPAFSEYVRDLLSLPGSLISSFDISGARQVATYAAGHPISFGRQFRRSLDALKSERGFEMVQDDLANRWYAPLRNVAGVALADAERALSKGEGTFISTLVNKIPGYRPSQRQYAALLNLSRDDLFAKMLKSYGADPNTIPEAELLRWGKLINISTGRGTALDFLTGNKVVGQPLLWAPRLYASRLQFPFEVLSSSPTVRKEAARQLVSFVGINTAMLKAGHAAGVWDVETDPRSADFGQIRIGNQRIDTWAGFRPFANLIARMATGERKSTTTGELSKVDRKSIAADFARSKLSPLVGTGVNLWTGENFIGKPFGVEDVPGQLITPLFGRDLVEAVRNMGPLGLPGALAAGVGAGVTTYEDSALDAEARARGFPSYAKAPETVQDEIDVAHPETVKARSEERLQSGGASAARERATVRRNTQYAEIPPDVSGRELRDSIHRIDAAYFAERKANDETFPSSALPSNDPNKRALDAYYEAATEAPDGSFDWDATEAKRALLAESWTPAQRAYVEQETGTIDPTLPPHVREVKQASRELTASGFFDLRNKAWTEFKAAHAAQLSQLPDDYYGWRDAEVKDVAKEIQAEGYEPRIARQLAAEQVAKYKTVTAFNEFFRKEFRHQWVVDHPELAARAWGFDYFDPDKQETAFLRSIAKAP